MVRLLNMPRRLADLCHELDPKNAFAIGKYLALWHLSYNAAADPVKFAKDPFMVKDRASAGQDPVSDKSWERLFDDVFLNEPAVIKLLDALKKNPGLGDKLKNAQTLDQAEKLAGEAEKKQVNAQAVVKFSDGWIWAKLTPDQRHGEGEMMQHCGDDSRGDLVSLRDPSMNPHVTMTWNDTKNIVYQIKGKQNRAPDRKYWPRIVQFFDEKKTSLADVDLDANLLTALVPVVDTVLMRTGFEEATDHPNGDVRSLVADFQEWITKHEPQDAELLKWFTIQIKFEQGKIYASNAIERDHAYNWSRRRSEWGWGYIDIGFGT